MPHKGTREKAKDPKDKGKRHAIAHAMAQKTQGMAHDMLRNMLRNTCCRVRRVRRVTRYDRHHCFHIRKQRFQVPYSGEGIMEDLCMKLAMQVVGIHKYFHSPLISH